MELKTFKRFIGAGLTPLLGSDTAPAVLNKALDNIHFVNRVMLEGGMLQRLAVTYHYTGVGIAPDVAVDAYLYDSVSKRFTKLTRTTLVPDVLNYIDFPAVVEADSVGGIAPGSADIVLVPIAAGGEPDGTYEFSGGFDAAARQSNVGIGGALPLPTGAASETKQDAAIVAIGSCTVAAHHASCTAKTDAARTTLESDREGNLHISAVCAHSRVLALPTTGAWTGDSVLPEGACDAVEAETDDVYVFGQQREAVRLASITPADWTAGAGWTFAGTVATHAAGGGTADLELPVHATYPIQLGVPYCVEYSVTMSAGTVTEKLGTAGATARAATGKFVQVLIPTVNGKLIFTPSADSDAAIDIANVWVYPHTYLPNKGQIKPCSFTRIAACSVKGAPATMTASPTTHIVKAHWYRRTV